MRALLFWIGLQCKYSYQGHLSKFFANRSMKISDVNNKFLTHKQSKQGAQHRNNTLVTIFDVSTRKCLLLTNLQRIYLGKPENFTFKKEEVNSPLPKFFLSKSHEFPS